jgi:hypothetical protein
MPNMITSILSVSYERFARACGHGARGAAHGAIGAYAHMRYAWPGEAHGAYTPPIRFFFSPPSATMELLYMVCMMTKHPDLKSIQLHHETLVTIADFTDLSKGGDKPRSTSLYHS